MKFKHLPLLGLALGLGIPSASAGDDERSFGDGLPEFLRQFDTNEDDLLDEEERQAIRDARQARRDEWVARWDEDLDGSLSSDEIEAFRQSIRDRIQERRAERFNGLDEDGDGVLSAGEFGEMPGIGWLGEERVAAIFDRMDTDDSGGVTLEEFNARLRHHRDPDDEGIAEDPPERPELPNWRDLWDQLRDRLRRGHDDGGEDGGGE